MQLTKRHGLLALAAIPAGAAVAVAAVTLTSASPAGTRPYAGSTPTPQTNAGTVPRPAAAAPAPQTFLSIIQAQAIAERVVGGRTIEADLEQEPTGSTYDVTVARADRTTYEVIVDAATGRVLRKSLDDDD